jgi:haloalkane dehalogenase
MASDVERVLEQHRSAGSRFVAGGVGSFVRREGDGEPVVLVHGLPSSSFLYRKVSRHLAEHGLEPVAFDLPGLGYADRPEDFDYTFDGLGRFAVEAVDALGLDRFHLVVHDAGGPVGFRLAAAMPARVRSLTVLNTVVTLDAVPFPMEVYARLVGDRPWRALPPAPVFRRMFRAVGVRDQDAVTDAEIDAWLALVRGDDEGRAYLRIMRNLRRTPGLDLRPVVDTRVAPYPVQIVWGAHDRVLPLRKQGWQVLELSGLPALHAVPGRHYLQEDCAPAIATLVAGLAGRQPVE